MAHLEEWWPILRFRSTTYSDKAISDVDGSGFYVFFCDLTRPQISLGEPPRHHPRFQMTVSQVMLNHDENQPNLWVVKKNTPQDIRAIFQGLNSRAVCESIVWNSVFINTFLHRCVTKRGIPQHGNFDVILGMATAHALVKNHQLRGDVPNVWTKTSHVFHCCVFISPCFKNYSHKDWLQLFLAHGSAGQWYSFCSLLKKST